MRNLNKKLGILGGGQLGKMLCQAASIWSIKTLVMDKSDYPASEIASEYFVGDINSEADVLNFGRKVDVLTIEIEHVNLAALFQLEQEGVEIHPKPSALKLIKDKGFQKQFYKKNNIETAPFELFESKEAITQAIHYGVLNFPFVQKTRSGGYDGKGVCVIKSEADLSLIMDAPSVIEQLANIEMEIAVIAARNKSGEIKCFDTVGMAFHGDANLVEELICPANIPQKIDEKAKQIAAEIIEKMNICGLLAVEFFYNKDGSLWVNEVAPRPHNSGHHTIENAYTSQYQQHIRGVMDFPLGDTTTRCPAMLLNLLGSEGFSGDAIYQGFEEVVAIKGVFPHLYGKKETKPFRKMGHITIIGEQMADIQQKAALVKKKLKVVA